jgi:hypothetical protein
MSKRQMVQETVHNGSDYDSNGWPPEDPDGFIRWFLDRIERIPVEHRKNAMIRFSTESGYYGDSSPHIEITYLRPETDGQFASRLKREASEAEFQARSKEQHERKLLAALQAKYGA